MWLILFFSIGNDDIKKKGAAACFVCAAADISWNTKFTNFFLRHDYIILFKSVIGDGRQTQLSKSEWFKSTTTRCNVCGTLSSYSQMI